MISRTARHVRGFTLLEVLLSIGLIAMLSAGVFAFMFQLNEGKAAIVGHALTSQAADAIIERLESDLMGAIAGDASGNAGVAGTASSLKVLSRGVSLPLKESDRQVSAGDLQGAEYSFIDGTLRAHRWNGGEATGTGESVSSRLGQLKFRYFDGENWADAFDSAASASLPVAVEVSIWFHTPPAETPRTTLAPTGSRGESKDSPTVEPNRNASAQASERATPADRVRIIVVPDGPTTIWKELR